MRLRHPARSAAPRPVRAVAAAVTLLTASSLLAACASSKPTAATIPSAAPSKAYPVTVTSCGVPVTYDQAPKRAVSNDINTTEDMLALGLESHMAGTFGVTGDGPVGQPVPPPPYQAGFAKVRDVSPNYFTLEELIGLRPDFLFAGWNYGLQAGTNLTPTYLAKYGIKTLVLTESCAHVQPGKDSVSINDTYQDRQPGGIGQDGELPGAGGTSALRPRRYDLNTTAKEHSRMLAALTLGSWRGTAAPAAG